MEGRRFIEGRWIRWNEARAQAAYAHGHWVRQTLGETLARAAEHTPSRVVIVDGDMRIDCRTSFERARGLASAMLSSARRPAASCRSCFRTGTKQRPSISPRSSPA